MKNLLKIGSALLLNSLLAMLLSVALDVPAPFAMAGVTVASLALSQVKLPSGVFNTLVLQQAYETEMLTAFRATRNWMARIPRKDKYVNNNAINVADTGADPSVLINNVTFPIAVAQRTDDTVVLALNRYDTTNTKIQRNELYALPYDKEGSVIRQHKEVLIEQTGAHGLFNLCVSGDTANTPVVLTTGGDNGNSRKRLLVADLVNLKLRLDLLKVPQQGRILVLCPDHVADLLIQDQSFQMRYNNTEKGTVMNQYGFEIYEDVYCNVFNASNAKKAFGAAPAGTDRNASTVFFAPRAFQATGDVEMFYQDKSTDPLNRATIVGFGLYHLIGPVKTVGFGALVSDATS